MLAGDFERNLRKLNPNFRIYCGDNPSRPAGLYYKNGGDLVHICGVDRNDIPEYTVWNGPFILLGGWRRVLKILVGKNLVSKYQVAKIFGVHLEYGNRPKQPRWTDPIKEALKEAYRQGSKKAEGYIELDDMLQIHRMKERGNSWR